MSSIVVAAIGWFILGFVFCGVAVYLWPPHALGRQLKRLHNLNVAHEHRILLQSQKLEEANQRLEKLAVMEELCDRLATRNEELEDSGTITGGLTDLGRNTDG